MTLATITAIVPTYKRPNLLKRALRSILRQSYTNFEILITDNASGPETDSVTYAFLQQDARIKLLKQCVNIGAIANFQTAFMHVQTPYVCFLPDDDFLGPTFFEETLAMFQKHPEIAFCGGGGMLIDKEYRIRDIKVQHQLRPPCGYYPPPTGYFAYLNSSFGIAFPGILFKTQVLKDLGGFDLRIRNGGDEHLITQCSARFPVYLLTDRPFYFAFQHQGSLSLQIDYPLFEKEALFLYENLANIPFTSKEREEIERFFQKRQLKILSNAYRHFYQLKQFAEAQKYAEKICHLAPSKKWKRKSQHTRLYHYFPALATLYENLKNLEKKIRRPKKRQEPKDKIDPSSDYWKAYTMALENDLSPFP